MINKLILIIFLVFLIGCETISIEDISLTEKEPIIKEEKIEQPKTQTNEEIETYFCPREDCTGALKKVLEKANESIKCAFYELNLNEIINVLDKKNEEIEVKIVIEKDNYEENLSYAVTDTKTKYMHNKFCIIDKHIVTTGSMNPTYNGANKNNNNLIIIKDKDLAINFLQEFEELWIDEKGEQTEKQNKIKTYFCPEDKCSEKIIDEIRKSEKNIYFMTFSFTHDEISKAMIDSNVSIYGIFENRGTGSQYSEYNYLKENGAKVYQDNNTGAMHHKVFIIDEEVVITGSMNPSKNGDTKNDENIIIIDDEKIASRYLEEFEFLEKNYVKS